MKTKINHLFLFAFFALLSFTACQEETSDVNNPDEQETIEPSSQLVELMSRTTANNGTMDDILDECSCFSIELPVTIIVSGITIVIENEDDLEELEDLFYDLEVDENFLDFVFPITIIYNDYNEVVIENEEQLNQFIEECEEDDEDEEIIECVDIVYPISFSVFNSEFNLVETVTIESDEALYEFLDDLEDNENTLIVSLNYPVNLEYANGETLEVNSNEELAEAIELASGDCFDEDYEEECDEENIAELLVECPWDIDTENNDFENYQIIFNEDGTLQITEGETTSAIGGEWNLSSTDNGLILNIFNLTAFQDDLEGEWLIAECDDDEIVIVRGDYEIQLEQDCEDDLECSIGDINEILHECAWGLDTNLIDTAVQVYVYFTPNGQVLVDNGDGTENQIGNYELMLVGGDIFVEFMLQQGFNDLSGQWQIVECEDDELYLVNGDNYIELEQECDLEPDCTQEDISTYLMSCPIIPTVNNYTPVLTEFAFHENNTITSLYEGDIYIYGTWEVGANDNGVFLNLFLGQGAIGESYNGEWYLSECSDDDGLLLYQGDNLLILVCGESEASYFECFEDREIEVCDNDGVNDGFMAFDLDAIYDCPQDDVVWTFHETIIDADVSNNALISPYTNSSNPQTIYARVELAGDASIYEIFEVEIEVQDCDEENCSEEDIDDILNECIWNPVNYNGSDNLMEWNFDFEEGSQIVVIYTGTQTIDATWTTSQSSEEGVTITFTNVSGPNIQAITGEWLVVECEDDRLELYRGDDILVLERTCE